MIGQNILLGTTVIMAVMLLGVLIYGAVIFFKEDEYLGGILCVATTVFAIGSATGWFLIVLGI